jgi:hypothetical protein
VIGGAQSDPPVQRLGPAILVQDVETLRHLYFCVQAGVQKLRRDGLSPAHLYPLSSLIRHGIMSADGHEYPAYVLAEEDSTSQDNDWLSVAEAATELELSERQIRRIAATGLGTRKGREWQLSKSKVLALKAERDWRARNGSRHFPSAA